MSCPSRVEDETSVIVRVVVRSDAGLAKVFPPAFERRDMEGLDSARLCAAKAMMGRCDSGVVRASESVGPVPIPEVRFLIAAEAAGLPEIHEHPDAERCERLLVLERFRTLRSH